jgi:hypothetical protein
VSFLLARQPPGWREISIVPHTALFVNKKSKQISRRTDPEISAKLPLDFFKIFCYNLFTR